MSLQTRSSLARGGGFPWFTFWPQGGAGKLRYEKSPVFTTFPRVLSSAVERWQWGRSPAAGVDKILWALQRRKMLLEHVQSSHVDCAKSAIVRPADTCARTK